MIRLVNLTPHSIKVFDDRNQMVEEIPSSKLPVRVVESCIARYGMAVKTDRKMVHGFLVKELVESKISNMPDKKQNTMYIVSRVAAQYIARYMQRDDILTIADYVRDPKSGVILGCRNFCKVIDIDKLKMILK